MHLEPVTRTIERMRPEADLDAILALEEECFTNPWTRQMFVWELQNSDVSHFFVLRLAGAGVVAYCSFWLLFDELHINNLAVSTAHRRQGHATSLLTAILNEGVRLGARRATLEVRPSNQAALRLYERLGFAVAGTRRDYYSSPREDALILWNDHLDESGESPA